MMTALQAETPQDRLARARAVLDAAEDRASRRIGGPRDRRGLRALRGGAASAASPAPHADGPAAADPTGERLPLPEALAPLIPHGTLRAGSSLAVRGQARSSLLLALAAAAVGEERWCAIAGMPDIGLGSALDAGLDPTRLAIITGSSVQEQPQLPQVLSALVDGVGVVMLGPHLDLPPTLWRSLLSRARAQDTLVLAASPPGRADLLLEARSISWAGLGSGSGRLRRRLLEVRAEGRGLHGDSAVQVLLPEARGLLAEAPGAARTAASTAQQPAPAAAGQELQVIRRAG